MTRVVNRVDLQHILARHSIRMGGDEVIEPSSVVDGYEEFTNEAGGWMGG